MIRRWHWINAVLVLLFSFPLHFLYQWTGESPWAAWFSPVNESIWEHLKLLVFPMLLLSIGEYFLYGRYYPNFLPVRLLSILTGMAAVLLSYYTYSGILGTHFLAADILTLVLGIAAAQVFSCHFLHTDCFTSPWSQFQAQAGFLVLILCFILFTWYPPSIALFQDPSLL